MGVIRGLAWFVAVVAMLGAAAATAVRLLEPAGGMYVRLVSFTPLALPAFLLAALLVLVGALRRKRAAIGVLLLALAGAALHAWWLSPFYLGQAPLPAGGSERLTVMTVNVLGGAADPREVVREASNRSVDLIALVEVTPDNVQVMDAAGFADLFPYRAGTPRAGVAGTMLLSRTPLTNPTALDTSFVSVAADVEVGGETIRAIAVHPRAPVGAAEDWRTDHAVIAEAAADADLVMGDFNATVDHAPMKRLRDLGLRSSAEAANTGWWPTWPMNGKYGSPIPLVQIDHVLVARKVAALDTEILEIDGTDHAAVVAELGLT